MTIYTILKKLKGLYIIINALIPIVWIIIFFSIFFDVSHLVNSSVNRINSTFISMVTTLEQATNSLNSSVQPIDNLEATLFQVSQKISSIPESIKIPDIQIPDANLPLKPKVKIIDNSAPIFRIEIDNIKIDMPTIPGFTIPLVNLDNLKTFLKTDIEILSELKQIVGIIPNLDVVKEYGQEIVFGTGEIGNLIQSIANKFIILFIIVASISAIAIPLLIFKYLKWVGDRFTKGWLLLNNKG